jgi:flagellar motor component MotA
MKLIKALVYGLLMILAFQFALSLYGLSWLELIDLHAIVFMLAGLALGLSNHPLSTVIRAFAQASGLMPYEDPPARSRQVISGLSRYALLSGALGTLLGVMVSLMNLDDVSALGHGLAVSSMCMLYALGLKVVVFAPLEQNLLQRELSEGGAL